ncbi:MAG: MFS transporter, partial [Ilumatobacteraceae bacterium]
IYFHEVRGISLGHAGLAVGAMSFTMVLLTPAAGHLSDRFGPRRILAAGCMVSIVAGSLYILVDSFRAALAVSMLLGVGNALWFPSQSALLAVIVTAEERPAVSAFARASLNLGAALGGVIGGFLVHANTIGAFRWLFGVNVATYVVFLAVLAGMPTGKVDHDEQVHHGGYRMVLADGFFVRLLGTDIAIALGFGFLFSFMPAYASALGIDKTTIGVLFTFGALSVVLTQIPTLRWVHGRNRMSWLAGMNMWFVAAFVLMVLTAHVPVAVAVVAIAIAQILGGFGEAVLGAVRQPLTSDLAPPRLVGRYYGLMTMVFQGGMGLANSVGAIVLQHSRTLVWTIPLTASVLGVAGSLALRTRIPANVALSP